MGYGVLKKAEVDRKEGRKVCPLGDGKDYSRGRVKSRDKASGL